MGFKVKGKGKPKELITGSKKVVATGNGKTEEKWEKETVDLEKKEGDK